MGETVTASVEFSFLRRQLNYDQILEKVHEAGSDDLPAFGGKVCWRI